MKGISPVIATVLILLMAVASVGGAWVWYSRQSTIVSGQTEEKISDQVAQQAASAISLADIYTSGSNVGLIINNAGASSVNVSGYKIVTGGTTTVNTTMVEKTINAQSTDTQLTTATCTTGNSVKISLFTSGTSTQEYSETCP